MKNKLFERDPQFRSPAAPKKQISFAVVAAEAILLFVAHSILHWSASSLTLLILGMVSVLFIFELIPIAIAALCVPVALWYAEVLPASDIFSGFCDSTVVLFGGMFVVGGAMFSTGIVSIIGSKMARITGKNETTAMLGVMLLSAVLSSMLSNTGTVAVLMPICLGFSKSMGCSRTRLLLPLAMACSLGGLISLVGTPPNTTVNSVLTAAGLGSFSFFEFAKIGIPLTIVGIIYLLTLGRVLLPARPFEPDEAEVIPSPEHYNTRKQIITLLIFIGLLIGMVLNLAPLAVLTTIAAGLCVVCGTLTESEAYGSISWSTLFLFAGYAAHGSGIGGFRCRRTDCERGGAAAGKQRQPLSHYVGAVSADHQPDTVHVQYGLCRSSGSHRAAHCFQSEHQPQECSDRDFGGCLLRAGHPHGHPAQYAGDEAGRIPLQRLSAGGSAADGALLSDHACAGSHILAPVHLILRGMESALFSETPFSLFSWNNAPATGMTGALFCFVRFIISSSGHLLP